MRKAGKQPAQDGQESQPGSDKIKLDLSRVMTGWNNRVAKGSFQIGAGGLPREAGIKLAASRRGVVGH